jgi:hypothetical protein
MVRTETIDDVRFDRDWERFREAVIQRRLRRLVIYDERGGVSGEHARHMMDAPHPEVTLASVLAELGLHIIDIEPHLPDDAHTAYTLREAHEEAVEIGARTGDRIDLEVTLYMVDGRTRAVMSGQLVRPPPPPVPPPAPDIEGVWPEIVARYRRPVRLDRSEVGLEQGEELASALRSVAGGGPVPIAGGGQLVGEAVMEGLENSERLTRQAGADYGFADTLARMAVDVGRPWDPRPPAPTPVVPPWATTHFRQFPLPQEVLVEGYRFGRDQAALLLDNLDHAPGRVGGDPEHPGSSRFLYSLRRQFGDTLGGRPDGRGGEIANIRREILAKIRRWRTENPNPDPL